MRCKVSSWRSFRQQRTPSVLTRRRRALCRANIEAQESAGATLSVFSPSKVNLFLRIIRRREDGYHDLASLFHVTDLGDDMSFTPIEGDKDVLTCNVPDIPTDDSNLVIKALNLFRERTGSPQHYAVMLDKRVPHGGGVGGGSGNAATTLWAANHLCGEPASNEELLQWSGDIGSDISVFFSCGAAYCTGRGEVVENVNPPLPLDLELLLVKPPMGLATPAIFKALDLSRLSTADPLQLLSDMKQCRQLRADLVVNDLEPPAFASLPELKQLKERLEQEGGFDTVFMTGSGSTLVCVGSTSPPAFLSEPRYEGTFVSPAHLIQRQPGEWYRPHTSQAA